MRYTKGSALYLTFLITTVVFIIVSASLDMSVLSLDLARSVAIDTITFHAADGGLERGIARLASNFEPFSFSYSTKLTAQRLIKVNVIAIKNGDLIDLLASATLFEGNKKLSDRHLKRLSIRYPLNKKNTGQFLEA